MIIAEILAIISYNALKKKLSRRDLLYETRNIIKYRSGPFSWETTMFHSCLWLLSFAIMAYIFDAFFPRISISSDVLFYAGNLVIFLFVALIISETQNEKTSERLKRDLLSRRTIMKYLLYDVVFITLDMFWDIQKVFSDEKDISRVSTFIYILGATFVLAISIWIILGGPKKLLNMMWSKIKSLKNSRKLSMT